MSAALAWLATPIARPRPLPTLPSADDALARAGSAGCSKGAKRVRESSSSTPTPLAHPPPPPARPSARGRAVPPPRVPAGDYHLLDRPDAVVRLLPAELARECTPALFDQLWRFSRHVPETRNPMNANATILRKQATFGACYRFGAQLSPRVDLPEEKWPALVRVALADAVGRVDERRRADFAAAAAAHVNWYPTGRAGMGRHADAEPSLVPGAPIFSYTFYSRGVASPERLFDWYRVGAKKPFAATPLGHGDLLIMCGETQRAAEHGVRATAAKAHENVRRVNITVRAFNDKGGDRVTKGGLGASVVTVRGDKFEASV